MLDVKATHPQYDSNLSLWNRMNDAFAGEDAIKAKGEIYLPMPSGMKVIADKIKQTNAFNAYKALAEFPEIVAPTIRGSAGLIHKEDTNIKLPKALEYLRDKATEDGLTLQLFHQQITLSLLRQGRFVMMPGVSEGGQMYLAGYGAKSCTNWDTNWALFDESGSERDQETGKWGEVRKFRECYLNEAGVFTSRLWVKEDHKKDEFIPQEEVLATINGRNGLNVFPVVFAGTFDLSSNVDEVPLSGLASLAIRAYTLDADYRRTLHWTSSPQPVITGVTKEDAPKTIGGNSLWILPGEGSKAEYLEFSGSGAGAQKEAIKDTLERGVMFGAQLFADNNRAAESGDAISLRLGAQRATLTTISKSSAAALEQLLQYTAIWSGSNPDEVTVEPNTEFVDPELSPQEILALVSGWQSGAYSKLTLFDNLKRGGVIDGERSFEDEEDLILEESPDLSMAGRDGDS
jgi:hypothetical protein